MASLAVAVADGAPRADAVDSRVPAALADVIARTLNLEPDLRYQTAAEVGQALEQVAAGLASRPIGDRGKRRDRHDDERGKQGACTPDEVRRPRLDPESRVSAVAAERRVEADGCDEADGSQQGKRDRQPDCDASGDDTHAVVDRER